jgi:hypothetical protein
VMHDDDRSSVRTEHFNIQTVVVDLHEHPVSSFVPVAAANAGRPGLTRSR